MTCRKWSRGSSSAASVCADARVVDEDVDAAEALQREGDEPLEVLVDADVARHRRRGRPPRRQALEPVGRRAAPTTCAPAAASTRAKRSPSPLEAPVTIATRP